MAPEPKRIQLLGCPIDSVTMDETVEECLQWCRDARQSHLLITVNSALLVMMRKNEALRTACRSGRLIVPDGLAVVWASRLLGMPLKERVAGVDLTARLLAAGDRGGLRVFFLGGTEEVVTTLVSVVRSTYPGLVVAGHRNGYFRQEDEPRIIEQIRTSRADILFVGMPTPFKEVWCYQHRDQLQATVLLGVGGSFDVLAGFTRRAPLWMQKIGMEWFWRLMMEPGRLWRRYLVTNTLFLGMCIRALLRGRRQGDVTNS